MTGRREALWAAAYALAWQTWRRARTWPPEAPHGPGEPMADAEVDRACRAEAEACCAVFDAGEGRP